VNTELGATEISLCLNFIKCNYVGCFVLFMKAEQLKAK